MSIFDYFGQLNLTGDQKEALHALGTFLKSDTPVFMLKGYAGTGKTTLLKGLSEYLKNEEKIPTHFMAPTGRAAMVINQKAKLGASTIHRYIYNFDELKETDDETSFKFFYDTRANVDGVNTVYLIDEASMISDSYSEDEFFRFGSGFLLKDLFRFAFEGNKRRKIIFIGDNAQLPPVGMNFSPALDEDYIRKAYSLNSATVTLKKVIRQQKESGILLTATRIREKIAQNTFNEFQIDYSKEDVSKTNPENFIDTYAKHAKESGVENNIVITYSNEQALNYNQLIREKRYRKEDAHLQKKDLLIITKNNYNYAVEVFNGMFVEVIEVGGISYEANPKFYIKGGETIERHLVFRDVVVEVTTPDFRKQPLKTTVLDNFLTAKEGRLHPYDQRALYVDFKNRMSEEGVKSDSKIFKDKIKNDKYFNALQVKYGYAITCHKSQGGEWPVAFVDFKVFMGQQTKSYYRWTYTAITRASRTLNCIDAPSYNALNQFIIRGVSQLSNIPGNRFYYPGENFIQYRLKKIEKLFQKEAIHFQAETLNNQVKIALQKGDKKGIASLWYKTNGFSKQTWEQKPADEALAGLVQKLLTDSLLPDEIPFNPQFDFQADLHEYFLGLLNETDITCTNIEQNQWYDRYYLITNADCAIITFHFNAKHYYTYARPQSTKGTEDKKLNHLIEKLRGNL